MPALGREEPPDVAVPEHEPVGRRTGDGGRLHVVRHVPPVPLGGVLRPRHDEDVPGVRVGIEPRPLGVEVRPDAAARGGVGLGEVADRRE